MIFVSDLTDKDWRKQREKRRRDHTGGRGENHERQQNSSCRL